MPPTHDVNGFSSATSAHYLRNPRRHKSISGAHQNVGVPQLKKLLQSLHSGPRAMSRRGTLVAAKWAERGSKQANIQAALSPMDETCKAL